ncbi:MAG: amidohydrolase family protein [Alphaproteobacteria bacterium]|nr:amidohydrolase family protein [Alphaproteobacteria bacterium]
MTGAGTTGAGTTGGNRRPAWRSAVAAAGALFSAACGGETPAGDPVDEAPRYETIIRGGMVYDGSGEPGRVADVAINGDRIAAVGDLADARAETTIDAAGRAVTPGFVNMLSWATASLIEDPRGMSDVTQGVTLEVMGEGWSMGPWTEDVKNDARDRMTDIKYDITWSTLGGYLQHLEDRGISPNVASFVGATTVRIHEVGYDDRRPTPEELERMQGLVRQAMAEGALGVGSSLIYAPAFFADTDELVALASAAAESGGSYISHMRSESARLLEAVDELIEISRRSGAPAEIYHLKASGEANWPKLEQVFEKVEAARAEGLKIRADMYTYPASSTGLNASMPLWVQEGGHDKWVERLKDPAIRARVIEEIRNPPDGWQPSISQAGGAEGVLLVGFRTERLKPLIGKTLAEVAEMRGVSSENAMIDLVIEDDHRVDVVYFTMSEENVKKKIAQPWVAFGSDAGAPAPEGVFIKSSTHPRAYGTFARLLGKYVRDEKVIPMEEAIRRLTSMPADNLKIAGRGRLAEGYFADVVVFDPETIADKATFAEPHQLSVGVEHVFVNGGHVIDGGAHTGATPGRFVKGPGWKGE